MDSCQYELDGRMILESNHPMHNGLTVKKSAVWSVLPVVIETIQFVFRWKRMIEE